MAALSIMWVHACVRLRLLLGNIQYNQRPPAYPWGRNVTARHLVLHSQNVHLSGNWQRVHSVICLLSH